MAKTKYLTMLVEHKTGGGWEVAGEDIPIRFESNSSLWDQMRAWTERRVAA